MPARPTAAPRAVALLAAVVLAIVAALTLTAGPAVADTGTLARTGVAAFDLDAGDSVGVVGDIGAGDGRETTVDSYDLSSGSRVATSAARPGANNALRGPDGRFATNPNSAASTRPATSGAHGNSLSSPRETYLYQLSDDSGHLKFGITSESNPLSRYSVSEMQGREMFVMSSGSRADMAAAERWLSSRIAGPEEFLPHVGSMADDVPWFLTPRLFTG